MENLPSSQCYLQTNDTKVSPIFATFSTAHQWPTFRNQRMLMLHLGPSRGMQPSKLGLVSQQKLGMFSLKNGGEGDLIFDWSFFLSDWNYQAEIAISSFLGAPGGQNEFTFQSRTADTPKLWFKLLILFTFWRDSSDSYGGSTQK